MKIITLLYKYFLVIVITVLSYLITYTWLKGFDYMTYRVIYLYVFFEVFFAVIATALVYSFVSFKFIRLILYPIVGYMIGDILELVYISIENPAQVKEFFKLVSCCIS